MSCFLPVLFFIATCILGAGETLLGWVGKQRVFLPIGVVKEVPILGSVSVEGMNCTGFTMDDFRTEDKHDSAAPGSLTLDITLTGIYTHCIVMAVERTYNKTLVFDNNVRIPTIQLAVFVHPQSLPTLKGPLPLGPITLGCNVDVHLEVLDISGSSPHVDLLQDMTSGPLSGAGMAVLQLAVSQEICKTLRESLPDMGNVRSQLETWLSAHQRPTAEDTPVDWGNYPPFQFFSLLFREELPALLNMALDIKPSMLKANFLTAGLNVNSLQIDDLSLSDDSHVALSGRTHEMTTEASIRKLRLILSVTMTVQPVAELFKNMISPSYAAEQHVAPFIKKYQVVSDLNNFQMQTGISAMLSHRKLRTLAIDQLQMVSCLFDCVPQDGLSVLDFSTNIMEASAVSVSKLVDPLETGTWSLVEAVINSVSAYNAEDVNAVMKGAANSVIHQLQNQSGTCGESEVDHGLPLLSSSFLVAAMAAFLLGSAVSLCIMCKKGIHSHLEDAPSVPVGTLQKASLLHLNEVELDSYRPDPVPYRPEFKTLESGTRELSAVSEESPTSSDKSWRDDGGPLCSHHVVPDFEKILIPFAMFSTLCAFLYSYFAIGTLVIAIFEWNGKQETIGPVFALSLLMSIADAWEGGAYGIAILVAVLCAIWPIVKLVFLMLAWTLPEARLSVRRRKRLLHFLDVAGSVSLIDTWLGVLIVAAFSYQYNSPDPSTTFRIQVVPKLPFFVFVLATVVSLSLGHYISELHLRTSLWSALKWDWETYVAAYPISSLTILKCCGREVRPVMLDHHSWPALKDVYPARACLVVPGLILTVVCSILGVMVNSFDMVVWGAIPDLLFDNREARFSYSVLTVGWNVDNILNPLDRGINRVYNVMLIIVVLLFVILIPLGSAISLLLLWCCPMMAHQQQRALRLGHIFDAWACLDLFAVAVVLAWAQLDRVAEKLQYGSNLAVLCNTLKGLTGDECIGTSCQLTMWFPVLAAAGALSLIMPKVAMHGIEEEMYDRHHSIDFELNAQSCTSTPLPSWKTSMTSSSDFEASDDEGPHVSTAATVFAAKFSK